MPHRTHFDQQLRELQDNIIKLTSMVTEAIDNAMLALSTRDIALAHQVIVADEAINLLRYETEDKAMLVIALQAPAASDLRYIIACIHIVVELERIGDHAAGIASLVERLEGEEDIDTLHKLPKMAARARDMVVAAVDTFVTRNAETAAALIARDDKLDRQYRRLRQEVLEEMRDETYVRRATFLLWVGHDLERIGDRATNIAERTIFMLTSKHVELPQQSTDDNL